MSNMERFIDLIVELKNVAFEQGTCSADSEKCEFFKRRSSRICQDLADLFKKGGGDKAFKEYGN